jgi:NAD(P)-dependent dehydrogenase (short-subunit alcohol dehydrogenase family)
MATWVITGANRGIGLAMAEELHGRGETVVAACRTPSDALRKLDVRIEKDVEVTSDTSIAAFAARLAGTTIDRLVLNAGILEWHSFEDVDLESVSHQIAVNAIGPLRVVRALVTHLARGAKIGLVTSRMGSIGDNTSGGAYGYRMSKAALNAAGKSLSLDLKPRGIAVVILHPGYVRTEMTGGNGTIDAPEAARGLLARIDELTLERSGEFRHMNGDVLPW